MRLYLINSPVVRAENLRFKEDGVRDVIKDVFLPWYNAYRFFVQNLERLERVFIDLTHCHFFNLRVNVMFNIYRRKESSLRTKKSHPTYRIISWIAGSCRILSRCYFSFTKRWLLTASTRLYLVWLDLSIISPIGMYE